MGNLEGKFVTKVNATGNGDIECPSGFSGKTDYISFETYGCPNSLIAEKIAWGLVLLGSVILSVKHAVALRRQWPLFLKLKDKEKRRGKIIQWYKHAPLQIILLGILTMCPATFGLGLVKVLELEDRQIGYSVVPSVCSIGIGVAGFATNALAEIRNFSMLLKNTKMNKEKARKLKRYLATRYWVSVFIYGVASFFAAFLGFAFQDENPYKTPMRFVSIVRNMSAAALLLGLLKINNVVSLETKAMLQEMSSAGNKSNETSKAQKVLDFLEASAKQKKKSSKLAILLYGIGSTPPFWPFQGYFFCASTCQVILTRNHPVNLYIQGSSKRVHDETQAQTGVTSSAQSSVKSSLPSDT